MQAPAAPGTRRAIDSRGHRIESQHDALCRFGSSASAGRRYPGISMQIEICKPLKNQDFGRFNLQEYIVGLCHL
jgi:hypothetical protein